MTGLELSLFFNLEKGDCKILENKGLEPFLSPVIPRIRERNMEFVDEEKPDLLGRGKVEAFFRIER
ncbi:hypothetical protein DPMN_173273 [Dreissena polymorpha]|uniref:Uncharacterized protein n=1 Tax=Dreissena polymorpha TaxID=45954 RepID=A0A9D4E4C3_DREPO|nr:hypothetical protein DPMN_173273 [Dreissena polymorpha]